MNSNEQLIEFIKEFTFYPLFSMSSKKALFKKHVDTKLSKRMKIYFLISLIMLGIVVYEVISTWYNHWYALCLFLVSIILWFFVSRMFHIFWNPDDQVVTSRIDRFGGVVLWIYVIFSFSRQYFLNTFVEHAYIMVITFAIVSGMMIWRFLGMKSRVLSTLKKQDII